MRKLPSKVEKRLPQRLQLDGLRSANRRESMWALSVLISYLLGSIPFGLIITRLWKGVDVRRYGSGNIGFTNVLRVAGPVPGALTLMLDVGKAFVSAKLISHLWADLPYLAPLCGVAAIIGHNWSVYLKFRGGKGIASTIGAFLALNFWITLAAFLIWAAVVALTRYVSLGSITMVCSLPVLVAAFGVVSGWSDWYTYLIIAASAAAAMGVVRHTSNIKRLLSGTERKLGERVEVR